MSFSAFGRFGFGLGHQFGSGFKAPSVTPDTTPPAKPTGLVATAGDGQVVLTWTDPADEDLAGVKVKRSTTSGSGYTTLDTVSPGVETYTDSSVSNDTTYYYILVSIDEVPNESAATSEASVTPTAPSLPLPSLGSRLWSDDLESGTLTRWLLDSGGEADTDSGTGSASNSTDQAHSGTHSLKMTIDTTSAGGGTRQFRWKELQDHTDIISTFWAYIPVRIGLDNSNNWFNFMQYKTIKGSDGAYVYNDPLWTLDIHERGGDESGGPNYLQLVDFDGDNTENAPDGLNLPVAEWFKITARFKAGLTDGIIQVWLNDELLFDRQDIATIRADQDYTGWSINCYADITHPSVTTIYVDDVSIHLAPTTAPTAGGTIANRIAQDSNDNYVTSPYTTGRFNNTDGSGDVLTPANLWLGANTRTYLRYPLAVPQGATITNAKLNFWSRSNIGAMALNIQAADVDDALQPSNATEAAAIQSSGLTTASVQWAESEVWSGDDWETPDIKSVIQEVVSRAGWTHDSHVMLVLSGVSGAAWNVEDYLDWADKAPLLTVTWTP